MRRVRHAPAELKGCPAKPWNFARIVRAGRHPEPAGGAVVRVVRFWASMRKQLPPATATAIAVLLALPATYAILRAYDVLFHDEPNPAAVAWSVHIAMFWRLAVGAYVAGMLAPVTYLAARRNLRRTVDTLYVLTFVVAAMITAQGLALP